MTAVLPRNNLSKTASKTRAICVCFASTAARGCVRAASTLRPLCVHFASTLRLRALAAASVLRALCVHFASTLRLRAPAAASVLRALCVQCASLRACGRSHKILFVDRRKISRFAFSLRNVGVGIRFQSSHTCQSHRLPVAAAENFFL